MPQEAISKDGKDKVFYVRAPGKEDSMQSDQLRAFIAKFFKERMVLSQKIGHIELQMGTFNMMLFEDNILFTNGSYLRQMEPFSFFQLYDIVLKGDDE